MNVQQQNQQKLKNSAFLKAIYDGLETTVKTGKFKINSMQLEVKSVNPYVLTDKSGININCQLSVETKSPIKDITGFEPKDLQNNMVQVNMWYIQCEFKPNTHNLQIVFLGEEAIFTPQQNLALSRTLHIKSVLEPAFLIQMDAKFQPLLQMVKNHTLKLTYSDRETMHDEFEGLTRFVKNRSCGPIDLTTIWGNPKITYQQQQQQPVQRMSPERLNRQFTPEKSPQKKPTPQKFQQQQQAQNTGSIKKYTVQKTLNNSGNQHLKISPSQAQVVIVKTSPMTANSNIMKSGMKNNTSFQQDQQQQQRLLSEEEEEKIICNVNGTKIAKKSLEKYEQLINFYGQRENKRDLIEKKRQLESIQKQKISYNTEEDRLAGDFRKASVRRQFEFEYPKRKQQKMIDIESDDERPTNFQSRQKNFDNDNTMFDFSGKQQQQQQQQMSDEDLDDVDELENYKIDLLLKEQAQLKADEVKKQQVQEQKKHQKKAEKNNKKQVQQQLKQQDQQQQKVDQKQKKISVENLQSMQFDFDTIKNWRSFSNQ